MRRAAHAVRRRRGSTVLETTIGAAVAFIVIAAGLSLTQTGSDLAHAAAAGDTAARRTEHLLATFAAEVRAGSANTICRLDGSPFPDGGADDGIVGRRVLGFSGAPVLASPVTLRWIAGPFGTGGDVVREQDGVTETIAFGVERFRVVRTGDTYGAVVTVRVADQVRSDRVARGTVSVRSRNP